jgi:N-formylglutamate amidohydrolase
MRKTIEECAFLCEKNDLPGWRQSANNIKTFKKQYRFIQKLKHSTSKDKTKQQEQKEKIKKAHQSYIDQANALLERARATREFW